MVEGTCDLVSSKSGGGRVRRRSHYFARSRVAARPVKYGIILNLAFKCCVLRFVPCFHECPIHRYFWKVATLARSLRMRNAITTGPFSINLENWNCKKKICPLETHQSPLYCKNAHVRFWTVFILKRAHFAKLPWKHFWALTGHMILCSGLQRMF